MKVHQNLLDLPRPHDQALEIGLTIGNFDGVHLGHQQLLAKIKSECEQRSLAFVVMTFIPHPQKILQPEKERFLLASYEHRRTLLEKAGVDHLIEMKFTRDFSTLGPEEFLEKFLFCYAGLKHLYLGYDFAFGANKQGGFDLVNEICVSRQIEVDIQPKFTHQGKVVSSSLLRDFITSGQVELTRSFLGHPFHLEGFVIKGEGRGRKLGFPTANVQVSSDLIVPEKGVYVTRTTHKGMTYQSVTNIGNNPTFRDSEQISIETNLFDFDQDIYGEELEIQFLKRIRHEKKFATVNDLISQIRLDVQVARNYSDTP
jgi:riboflavin kinase / FMN adenylyltransferase